MNLAAQFAEYRKKQQEIEDALEMLRKEKDIILFPSGTVARGFYNALLNYDIKVSFFGDNALEKIGNEMNGVEILSFEEILSKHKNALILVGTRVYEDEIRKHFLNSGFASDRVLFYDFSYYRKMQISNFYENLSSDEEQFDQVYNLLADDLSKKTFLQKIKYMHSFDSGDIEVIRCKNAMYFDSDFYRPQKGEVVVDGGGFTGDTFLEYREINPDYGKYYIFEPDPENFKVLSENLNGYEAIEAINKGLGEKDDKLVFYIRAGATTSDKGDLVCDEKMVLPVTSIDKVVNGGRVDFIKLDVEGSEREALLGSVETIRKYSPNLAVCVYHKPMDIVELPLLLHELCPEGELYIRHYGKTGNDTVCYVLNGR